MKKLLILPLSLFLLTQSCTHDGEAEENDINVKYAFFGDTISPENAISKEEMYNQYQKINEGDSIKVKFTSTIENVCQVKGCWMNLNLTENASAYIRFKDYGFFMPMNAAGSEVIVDGIAFVSERTVSELRHDAEDAGLTEKEINQINEPEVTYGFTATGVLIKKN